MKLLRLLHSPPTPRTDAAMAQQTHFSWHGTQFRQLFGRRVVAPPVIAAAAAALATHGRAHSVPQQAGGPPAGFQQAQTLPTARPTARPGPNLKGGLMGGPKLEGRGDGRPT